MSYDRIVSYHVMMRDTWFYRSRSEGDVFVRARGIVTSMI
jgi:hypothetical protein